MALCVVTRDAGCRRGAVNVLVACYLGATSGLHTCRDGLDMFRHGAASVSRWRFASSLEMLGAVVAP